jgi:hypothetical protein
MQGQILPKIGCQQIPVSDPVEFHACIVPVLTAHSCLPIRASGGIDQPLAD